MPFLMPFNVLFGTFLLLTAQAGSAPVDICLISENCYRQYLDYLVRNKGWTKSSGLIPIYTSPCGKKGCYADWEGQIYACHHKKKLTTAEIAAFFEQFQ